MAVTSYSSGKVACFYLSVTVSSACLEKSRRRRDQKSWMKISVSTLSSFIDTSAPQWIVVDGPADTVLCVVVMSFIMACTLPYAPCESYL